MPARLNACSDGLNEDFFIPCQMCCTYGAIIPIILIFYKANAPKGLKACNISNHQIPKFANHRIPKSTNLQITTLPNQIICKSPHFQITKSSNLQITKSTNFQIIKSSNYQIVFSYSFTASTKALALSTGTFGVMP